MLTFLLLAKIQACPMTCLCTAMSAPFSTCTRRQTMLKLQQTVLLKHQRNASTIIRPTVQGQQHAEFLHSCLSNKHHHQGNVKSAKAVKVASCSSPEDHLCW